MTKVIHIVISLEPGGLERLVVDLTNERNREFPGSTSICCLDKRRDETGNLSSKGGSARLHRCTKCFGQALGGKPEGGDGEGEESGEYSTTKHAKDTKGGGEPVVFCLNADRSRFPWDRAAVRRLREMIDDRGQRTEDGGPVRRSTELCRASRRAEDGAQPFNLVRRERIRLWRKPSTFNSLVVLHAHNMAAWQYAVLAARGTGAKVVYTQHGANPHVHGIVNRIRACWLMRHTERIVAVSKATAEAMSETLGIPGERIEVVRNGVGVGEDCRLQTADCRPGEGQIPKYPNTQRPNQHSSSRRHERTTSNLTTEQRRREFGVPADAFVVGSVGRFSSEKNYPLLIEAFSLLHKRRPDARLLLVGDGPERRSLEQSAKSMGVEDCVIFTGFRDDARELLQTMDAFCLSSDSEGLSLALLEAGICGKAVVVTNAGGNAEVVRDGVDGFVVPPRSVTALANALAKLGMDLKLRGEMGQALRTRVLEQYSFSRMMSEYEKLYDIVSR